MAEFRALLWLELRSLYGWNRFLHEKEKKAKNRYRLLLAVTLLLVALFSAYVAGTVIGLSALGVADLTPLLLIALAMAALFLFGLFTAGDRLFSQKGYDILASFPLRTKTVVFSRFFAMYSEDLCLSLVIFLPGYLTYAILCRPAPSFYGIAFLGILFVPWIPLALASLWGTLLLWLTVRMKHRTLVQAVLSIALVVGGLMLSFGAQDLAEGDLSALAALLQEAQATLAACFPPAAWLADALLGKSPLGLLWFLLLSLGAGLLCLVLAIQGFHPISHSLCAVHTKGGNTVRAPKRRSLYQALYLREAKRYLSCGVYVTNTVMGPVLGCVLALFLPVTGMESLQGILPIAIPWEALLPFVFSAVFCMMPSCAVSVSMEGKNIWLLKALPIPTKAWLDGKLLWTFTLMAPAYLLTQLCLFWILRPTWGQGLLFLWIPALVAVCSCVLAVTVDLKFRNFAWEKEVHVVKQGISAVGGFIGPLLSLLWGAGTLLLSKNTRPFLHLGVSILLLALTAVCYCKNNRTPMEQL